MRRLWILAVVACLAASCGSEEATDTDPSSIPPTATTTAPLTTSATTAPAPPTTAASSSTAAATTTTTTAVPTALWTVDAYGRTPSQAVNGDALGSGCAPGTDDLPDGIWFGWVESSGLSKIEFDLACLWPGRIQPAVSNDAARVRTVPTSADTLVYRNDADPISFSAWGGETTVAANAPGLAATRPFWVFVNNRVATEMSECPATIDWMLNPSAWPPMGPGCCEEGTVAPPSPTAPWPADGWPADGFYSASAVVTGPELEITLRKWLRCRDHPGMCPDWWTGDEVTTDPDAPTLRRILPLDSELTVVIRPIQWDTSIVGDGYALRALLVDLNTSMERWLANPDVSWDELEELAKDPLFPFGGPYGPEFVGGDEYGYRGPGGVHLTPYGDETSLPGWTALEIRGGSPILYLHAGIVAG